LNLQTERKGRDGETFYWICVCKQLYTNHKTSRTQ
ncbi:uncharacterized, partial [Tachysurus ichikawai]